MFQYLLHQIYILYHFHHNLLMDVHKLVRYSNSYFNFNCNLNISINHDHHLKQLNVNCYTCNIHNLNLIINTFSFHRLKK